MSADGFAPLVEADLLLAVMDSLRADADVQAILGNPARLFDDETDSPAYPYVRLERHECRDAGASGVCGQEHKLSFATFSRHGGRSEAKKVLGALRAAVDRLEISLPQQRSVFAHVTYSDAMRARDRRAFRGVLRVRIITEEA